MLRYGLDRRSARVVALGVCLGLALSAQTALEFQVKAAFLLNFTKFAEWPESAFEGRESPLTICVYPAAADPFGHALEEIVQNETVNRRPVMVRKLDEPPVAKTCQLVYFDSAERNITEVLHKLGPGVLAVGDNDTFLRDGGAIAFVVENRRVRFDVNNSAATAAGIKLSSKLLAVARRVEK
jgi:hypothetical protein